MPKYNDRFVIRGAKPIRIQSASRPVEGLLCLLIPKPTKELLHSTGSSLVAFFIISSSTKLSSRFCSGVMLLRKSSTLALVGFILLSASFDFLSAILNFYLSQVVISQIYSKCYRLLQISTQPLRIVSGSVITAFC